MTAELEARRDEIRIALGNLGDMRQGTLIERYRKCGKANCRCADNDAFAHGPSWSLTRAVKAKTLTRIIPIRALDQTRMQLAEFKEFRALNQELVEVNEKICESKLTGSAGSETAPAKKKGSKGRSMPPSSQKSKR